MPEPQSRRGNVITTSEFEAPFQTPIFPLGVGGLDLTSALDAIAPGRFSRLTNCVWNVGEPRVLTGRPGQVALATSGGTEVHSLVRLTDLQPATPDSTYVWGIDDGLFLGASGALTEIDSGYSGDPIVFLPLRPPLSGDPWAYLGDRDRMRKVRFDGLTLEIGLQAPTLAVTTALDIESVTNIAQFSALDGTNADAWTGNPGTDYSDPPVPTDPPITNTTIHFVVQPGAAAAALNGFWSFWGLPVTRDLNLVGALPASDDDVMQLNLLLVQPWATAEVRLYVVVSETFSPSVLPGTISTDGVTNIDYYVLTIRPDDFAPSVGLLQAQIDSAESARVATARDASLEASSENKRYPWLRARQIDTETPHGRIIRQNDTFAESRDPARDLTAEASGASAATTRFGTVGIPLRRGSFKRYGTTTGRDWGTVTGLILYVQASPQASDEIGIDIYSWVLTGGSGPDTMEPGAQSYDHRYTHYDPRTGAESNPSPVMDETVFLDSLRRAILVNPVAYGDGDIRQRVYRRGGTNYSDWHFVGENESDGGQFQDVESDLGIVAAGTVEIDHYQPVPTVDDAGETVLAQPLPVLFGPYNGQILGLGDPYRPGHVYASKPDEPDHWPPDMNVEVCPPSEQLMNGLMYGGQPYVFSREAGYPIYGNLVGEAGVTAGPSMCKHGLAGRWAVAQGAGSMWFVSPDNVYRTQGGPETAVGNDIVPLFQGKTVNGYLPIDLSEEAALRLTVYAHELWFGYLDTEGNRQVLILQIQTGQWRHYAFGTPVSALYADEGNPGDVALILGGAATGDGYYHGGTDDLGDPITSLWRTGSWDWGKPREEKLFGDQILDVDPHGAGLTLTNYVNSETVTNPAQTLAGFSGRTRTIWDSFGTIPQRARTLATQVEWTTSETPPECFVFGTAITMQPDLTINRVTNWDDLGHPDEVYLMGVTFDCDTGGVDRTILVERDWAGIISTVATLLVNCDGRHKIKFSWTALQANQVRIRPTDDCLAWILYRADWIWQPEPPRIARWDIHFENAWDQYLTGLDLYVDTDAQTKRIIIEVDGVALTNPDTLNAWWDITTTGRRVVHLTTPTVPPVRGHVFRFYATDDNPGLLYQHRWHLAEEPSEQHNWNQPFTILGTQADKYVKAILFEMDSFGLDKTVRVEADGVQVDTLTVNTNGRKVVQVAITQQLGRVWRFIPTDSNPSRLYTIRLAFDEEPFCLTRWETQELPYGNLDFKYLTQCQVTLKSSAEVTLSIAMQTSQVDGVAFTTRTYTLPSTAGAKRTLFVPVEAFKWILAKFLLTSEDAFWLYQEETRVTVQPWLGGASYLVHPFGNADVDPTRSMVNASLASARSGGGTE